MTTCPTTDQFLAYLAEQFPATAGHIPLRTMLNAMKDGSDERAVAAFVQGVVHRSEHPEWESANETEAVARKLLAEGKLGR